MSTMSVSFRQGTGGHTRGAVPRLNEVGHMWLVAVDVHLVP
jgi:hypothetical protein